MHETLLFFLLLLFRYKSIFYKQKSSLPIGFPLSGILACLFLEFLESGHFKFIIPKDFNYLCYIDDILFIYSWNNDLIKIMDWLNNIESSVDFAYKLENNNTLLFLNISRISNDNNLEIKVYYKSTNKNDYVHFYLHHNTKIKREIIIGFYHRALRIYTPKFLNYEFVYIENSFM